MIRQSKQHVAAAGEGDGEHFRFTTAVGLFAIAAELARPVRALPPALCTRTGSTIIARRPHPVAGRRLLEQIAEQSAGAITFVGQVLAVVGAAPVVPGASFVPGVVGPLTFAIALTVLLLNPELASVHAPA